MASTKSGKVDVNARRAARLGAVQALYQMELSGATTEEVIEQFIEHRLGREIEGTQYPEADELFFSKTVRGVVEQQVAIDRLIENSLASGWTMGRIDTTLRALLRCAAHELGFVKEIPPRVAINEFVDITHAFFEDAEPKFVNGILDRIARDMRADEM